MQLLRVERLSLLALMTAGKKARGPFLGTEMPSDLDADPRGLKNLIAIFGQEGDSLKALYYLRRSNEWGGGGGEVR